MAKSRTLFIYRHPKVYEWVMRLLHGRDFEERYSAIAAEIPDGSEVVELCPGDAYLYRHYLRPRKVVYRGFEGSKEFVEAGCKAGIPLEHADVRTLEIPEVDVIVIQASLHIFHPRIDDLMRRMLESARLRVLIAEPVRNLSSSSNRWIAGIARALTGGKRDGSAGFRFTEESLRLFLAKYPEFERAAPASGGRELVAVLRGRRR